MKIKSNKQKGMDFEKICKETINSGAINLDGDLIVKTDNGEFMIENKFTDGSGFRITTKIIEKLWNMACDCGKTPRLMIGIKKGERQIWLLTCAIKIQNI